MILASIAYSNDRPLLTVWVSTNWLYITTRLISFASDVGAACIRRLGSQVVGARRYIFPVLTLMKERFAK